MKLLLVKCERSSVRVKRRENGSDRYWMLYQKLYLNVKCIPCYECRRSMQHDAFLGVTTQENNVLDTCRTTKR